jgi:hypothetical protein
MPRPTPRRVETVAADLRERGLETEPQDYGVLARGDAAFHDRDAPLLVVEPRDGDPLTLISAVDNAAAAGAVPLLVGHRDTVAAAADLLGAPFALRGDADGRQFHSIADRIRLTDDTFACVRTGATPRWHEVADSGGSDDPGLLLEAAGETLAALEGVDALRCPGPEPSAFRYRYERDERGRFAVRDRDGVAGRYAGVGAMRADGFRPVALPLVPEHHVRTNAALARAALLGTVDDGAVRYRAP